MRGTLGCFIAIVGSLIGSIGDTTLRVARDREDRGFIASHQRKYGISICGFILSTIVEPILIVCSLSFASATLVTPIAALRVALNAVFSNLFLRAALLQQHRYGICLISAGIVLSLFASGETELDSPYTLEQLSKLYTQSPYLAFVVLCLTAVGFFAYTSSNRAQQIQTTEVIPEGVSCSPPRIGYDTRRTEGDIEDVIDVEGCPRNEQRSKLRSSYNTSLPTDQHQQKAGSLSRRLVMMRVNVPWGFQRFSLAAISGIAGGNAVVIGDTLLRMANHPDNDSSFLPTRLPFVCLFIFMSLLLLTQVYSLNKGINTFDGLQMIPQANAVLITVACLASLNVYSQSFSFSISRLTLLTCGTCCVVWGLIILSHADTKREIAELEILELQLVSYAMNDRTVIGSNLSSDSGDLDNGWDELTNADLLGDASSVAYGRDVDGRMTRPSASDDVLDERLSDGQTNTNGDVNVYGKYLRDILSNDLMNKNIMANGSRRLKAHFAADVKTVAYKRLINTDNDEGESRQRQIQRANGDLCGADVESIPRIISQSKEDRPLADWTKSLEQIAIDSPEGSISPIDHTRSSIDRLYYLDSDHGHSPY